jgi:hypothetical protein
MSERTTKTVSDLSIGDQIEITGFDGARTVHAGKKLDKGAHKGMFELKFADQAGNVETALFKGEEEVAVVGHVDVAKKGDAVKLKPGKKSPKAGGKKTDDAKAAPAPRPARSPRRTPPTRSCPPLTPPTRFWPRLARP